MSIVNEVPGGDAPDPCSPEGPGPAALAAGVPSADAVPQAAPQVTVFHRRRLRAMWRSAGWPCHDMVELELLAAGLLERIRHPSGHETLRVTDAGVLLLAQTLQKNRGCRDAHEALVERVATAMQRDGRIAWCGISLRARVGTAWQIAKPDVFSIRNTTVEDYLLPVVHEIKVQRSDLLGDLRRKAKREAYIDLSSECWYVIKAGIAQPQEIPLECGVIVATETSLEVARAAPRRAMKPSFALWMSLAKSTPSRGSGEDAQALLGDASMDDVGADDRLSA
jgi:hypothetical protein